MDTLLFTLHFYYGGNHMKFSCEKYLLQGACNIASRAAASKSPIPALEGLQISCEDKLYVKGYDLKKGIVTGIEADIVQCGVIVVGARLFGEMIRRLPDGIVTVSTDEKDNIYKRLNVESLSFSNGEQRVSITGNRILSKAGVISLTTPNIGLEDDEQYEHNNDLALDIDAVKYEAKAYIEERKWGVKEASLDFRDVDPFKAEAGDVPDAGQQAPKKRGRKAKKAA